MKLDKYLRYSLLNFFVQFITYKIVSSKFIGKLPRTNFRFFYSLTINFVAQFGIVPVEVVFNAKQKCPRLVSPLTFVDSSRDLVWTHPYCCGERLPTWWRHEILSHDVIARKRTLNTDAVLFCKDLNFLSSACFDCIFLVFFYFSVRNKVAIWKLNFAHRIWFFSFI